VSRDRSPESQHSLTLPSYLNMNGCEEEGLYRIPGSGKEVKHWQRRFDTELDIDLFEEPDLHDINTIGSMFKAWLRDLPDEILPKSVQNKVAQQCVGASRTPQLLKDELSKLPPFHYYLLFAITCHLSLLTSFSDKNKMDYRNLCICFQPCLKIDAFCFQFLVMDWKNCWQGCWTEKEFLDEEYRYEREGSVNESEDLAIDDRAISSSGSSQHQQQGQHQQQPGSNQHQLAPPKTSDGTHQRKSSVPRAKQRSLSTSADNRKSSGNNSPGSHSAAQSVPSVPRVVTTPEPKRPEPEKLPEVGSLSPIRM
jgi:RhoGAP domain